MNNTVILDIEGKKIECKSFVKHREYFEFYLTNINDYDFLKEWFLNKIDFTNMKITYVKNIICYSKRLYRLRKLYKINEEHNKDLSYVHYNFYNCYNDYRLALLSFLLEGDLFPKS